MAKEKKKVSKTPEVTDRTLWYDSINFMPQEDKNQMWAAQQLFFAKQNSVQFLDRGKCMKYRRLNQLELDEKIYRDLIDPPSPLGGGGTASYFAADFKANPIFVHLINIVRAKLDKICLENQLQVNEIDKFAKSQKQKDKDRIIYQQEFRKIVNEVNEQLGLPPIKESQSPYNYVKSLGKEGMDRAIDSVDSYLDYIKSQIKDSHDMTLYETNVYKGDVEKGIELGIEHYLIKMNKWRNWVEFFNADLMNFNRTAGLWYTDKTSGRGTVKYIEPYKLYTSPFKTKTGEDIMWWWVEEEITFGDFVRRFGVTLSDEQLKEVFELNRENGNHSLVWSGAKGASGSQAKITIGYASVLTQDALRFSEELVNNRIPSLKPQTATWLPTEKDGLPSDAMRQKIYNVWYSFYYVPPPATSRFNSNIPINWEWQSKYIFDLEKNIDMYRYGVDLRYAKSSLVVWKDERPSFMDIMQAFMPKINTTWHKFQNCLVQDTTALVMSNDFLTGLLKSSDESNKTNTGDPDTPSGGNGLDPVQESIKSLRQGGLAFLNFRDKQGNVILEPSKMFVYVDSKHIDKAERYLKLIMEQYSMLQIALAQNDLSEGQNAKPRTNAMSVEASLQSSQDGIWFVEKPVREFQIMFGERCVQWQLAVLKEHKDYGYSKRFDEMSNVIGMGNALMLLGLEEIHAEDIGLSVELQDVRQMKEYYIGLTNQYLKDGKIDGADVEMIIGSITQNYKYGACLLSISAKKMAKELADKEELAFKRQMQLEQQKQQTAMAMVAAKTDSNIKTIQAQGEVDAKLDQLLAMLKTQSQKDITDHRTGGRIQQDTAKADLKEKAESQKPFEQQQTAAA